jgi:hypothetical protein
MFCGASGDEPKGRPRSMEARMDVSLLIEIAVLVLRLIAAGAAG